MAIIRTRRSSSAAAYSRQTFSWTICRFFGPYMHRSVCPVHCGTTADRIRMPFSIKGRTGPGTRQVVRFGDRSTGRGTFGGKFVARHCNQWGLYGVRMRQRHHAALFPNYFGQTWIWRKLFQSSNALVQKCLTRKSKGRQKDRTSPPLQKEEGKCPPVHPRIYAYGG